MLLICNNLHIFYILPYKQGVSGSNPLAPTLKGLSKVRNFVQVQSLSEFKTAVYFHNT